MATIKSWKAQKPTFRKHKRKVYQGVIDTGNFVYQLGESDILRKPSKEVSLEHIQTVVFKEKVKYLKSCLRKYRKLTGFGRGVAAVQVGIPERFSVIYMPNLKEELLVIINPTITRKSPQNLRYPEMCMSANPLIASVIRPAWIELEYFDESGKKQIWKQHDTTTENRIYNRVFQHEVDHMDGIINIDLVESKTIVFESDPKFYDTAKFEEIK